MSRRHSGIFLHFSQAEPLQRLQPCETSASLRRGIQEQERDRTRCDREQFRLEQIHGTACALEGNVLIWNAEGAFHSSCNAEVNSRESVFVSLFFFFDHYDNAPIFF